ncbi:unnamed protein product [Rhizopus stolonifer]
MISIAQSQILNNISQVIDHIADKAPLASSNQPAPTTAPSPAPQTMPPQTTSPPAPPAPPAFSSTEKPKITTTTAPKPIETTSVTTAPPQNSSKKDVPTTDPVTTQPTKTSDNTPTNSPKASEKKTDRQSPTNNTTNDSPTRTTAPKSPNEIKTPSKAFPSGPPEHESDDKPSSNSSSPAIKPVPDSAKSPNTNDNNDKTGIVAGAVISSLIGLAILSGFLTWCNRHKGCAGKRKRKPEFEDYGLADTDFPQSRPLATQNMTTVPNTISPALPQSNDQSNYNSKELNVGYAAPYQVIDHKNNYQHQPEYYYNNSHPPHDSGTGYYDENGYYYENATYQEEYYTNQPYTYPNQYPPNTNYYKPDQVTESTQHHPYT